MKITRRRVIVTGIAAGGGLAVAYGLNSLKDGDSRPKFGASTPEDFVLHAYVKISPEGIVTVAVPSAELGQGVTTAIPMLVAEELDANWDDVRYELAPLDKDYGFYAIAEGVTKMFMSPGTWADMAGWALWKITPLIGLTMTGGSSTILGNYEYLRTVGAAAKSMLVQAAAAALGVDEDELTTEKGRILHAASGRSLGYGEVAEAAAAFDPPSSSGPLSYPSDNSIIGQPLHRLDTPEKVDGSALYGIDVQVPGMVYAAIRHSPVFGGTLKGFNQGAALARQGVLAVVPVFEDSIAVIAGSMDPADESGDVLR